MNTHKEKMIEMKTWLKATTKEIRSLKNKFKQEQRDCKGHTGVYSTLIKLTDEYRMKHIAYSMARGRTLEQICPKPKNDKKVYWLDSIPYWRGSKSGMLAKIEAIKVNLMTDDVVAEEAKS